MTNNLLQNPWTGIGLAVAGICFLLGVIVFKYATTKREEHKTCYFHSGLVQDISNLVKIVSKLEHKIDTLCSRIDNFLNRRS